MLVLFIRKKSKILRYIYFLKKVTSITKIDIYKGKRQIFEIRKRVIILNIFIKWGREIFYQVNFIVLTILQPS